MAELASLVRAAGRSHAAVTAVCACHVWTRALLARDRQPTVGVKSPQSDVSRLLRLGLVFLALMREVSQADESPVCAGRLVSVFKLQYL